MDIKKLCIYSLIFIWCGASDKEASNEDAKEERQYMERYNQEGRLFLSGCRDYLEWAAQEEFKIPTDPEGVSRVHTRKPSFWHTFLSYFVHDLHKK